MRVGVSYVIACGKQNIFLIFLSRKMEAKTIFKNTIQIIIGGIGFVATFCTMIDLMYFLSDPNYSRKTSLSKDISRSATWSLLIDQSLLSLFILSHSFLPKIKGTLMKYGLQDLHRSFYIIVTTLSLQVLIRYWHDIPEITLWRFNMNSGPVWWLFSAVHIVAWLMIYIGNICMDVNELIGIKHIYYSIMNLPNPNSRKSFQLRRLQEHMRHPCFISFLLIFWCLPIMSLDRLMLAVMFSSYMYFAWSPDENDYAYQYHQYITKFHELETLH